MDAINSSTNDGQFGDKMSAKIVSRMYFCLGLIHNGVLTQKELGRRTGSTVREVRYVLNILYKNGYIDIKNPHSNKWKKYVITQAGKALLGSLRAGEPQSYKPKNEKTRYKFEIHNQENVRTMINSTLYLFKKNPHVRNIEQYDARIDGHWVQVTFGKSKSSLVITAPQYKARSFAESAWMAVDGILRLYHQLDRKWNLGLSVPTQIDGHVAQHTDFASAVMRMTGGRQVKLGNYWINQSPPSFIPEEESDDMEKLEKIIRTHVELPDKFNQIETTLGKLNQSISTGRGEMEMTNYNIDRLAGVVSNMADALERIAETQKELSANNSKLTYSVTTIAEKLTDLINMVNPKPADNQVTPDDKFKNDVFGSMFG